MAAASSGAQSDGHAPQDTRPQPVQHQMHPHHFNLPSTSSSVAYQLQPQLPKQLLQSAQQFHQKPKIKYIPRSNSGGHLNSIVESNILINKAGTSSAVANHSLSGVQTSDIGLRGGVLLPNVAPKISARHPNLIVKQATHQKLQQPHPVPHPLAKPTKPNSAPYPQQPNIAPGWRRLTANDEVIYVSPTGAALRNLDQIKDYLLSQGTCKCGLPCPLRTETFFDFDSEVPTKQSSDDLPRVPCSHQHHYLEQQTLDKRDVKRKKQQPLEWTSSPSGSPASLSESTSSTPPSQVMAPSSDASRFQVNPSLAGLENSVENVAQNYLQQANGPSVVYQSGNPPDSNKPLSRTPPWRKNSSLNQPKSESTEQQSTAVYAEDRVPPLPQQHIPQQQPPPQQQMPAQLMQHHPQAAQPVNQLTKSRVVAKKFPTFKEDPTGYLNQQTALLHNTISTLHSPNGSPSIEVNQKFSNQKAVPSVSTVIPKPTVVKVEEDKFQYQHSSVIAGSEPPVTSIGKIRQIIHNTEQNQLIINQRQPKEDSPQFVKVQQAPQPTASCDSNSGQLQLQQQMQLRMQIQQQQQLMRQTQQLQMVKASAASETFQSQPYVETRGRPRLTPHVVMSTYSRESPVSSSTTFSRATPDRLSASGTPDSKGPVQAGMVTTSNNEPSGSTPSPVESPESSRSRTPLSMPSHFFPPKLMTSHGSHKNTITSVTAGKNSTSTTSVNQSTAVKSILVDSETDSTIQMLDSQNTSIRIINQQTGTSNVILNTTNSALKSRGPMQMVQHCLPASTNMSSMQQVMTNSTGNSQLIMTSTGQILVMSPQQQQSTGGGPAPHKPQQILINSSPTGSRTVMMHSPQQQVVINQPTVSSGTTAQFINGQLIQQQQSQPQHQQQSNNVVIQNSQVLQSTGHSSSYLMNSPNMIINNSNLIANANNLHQQQQHHHHHHQQQQQQQQGGQSQLLTTGTGTKIISNNGNIITTNQTNMLATSAPTMMAPNSLQPNNLGQQTMVLNTMPNGTMVLQPHFTTMDGQQVVINQDNTTTTYVQQQHGHILISPDAKRRAKKRKGSSSSGSLTPQGLSPQQIQLSPTIQQHGNGGQPPPVSPGVGTMMQITPQYQQQSFQLSPGLTLVQKQNTAPQQQILLQNGQTIIQPLNLIGQHQLLIPAGMMMTPETTTLVQIQNVAPCGSILPQGMVLRTPSPQQKQFMSPNTGQQFIVNQNGQISPIGQIYNTQVGLVMPPQSSAAPTFVQQNTTIVQQQTTMMSNSGGNGGGGGHGGNTMTNAQNLINDLNAGHSVSTQTAQAQQHAGSASPPDTTTHSPRSPERPLSQRSGGSNDSMSMAMVHQVSSSEPDSVISPSGVDSAQSPSNIDYSERSGGIPYQLHSYKATESKIRRIQTPTQYTNTNILTTGHVNQTSSSMTPDSHDLPQSSSSSNSPITTSFCVGELVWGAVRGHPAWPGKVIQAPDGFTTPSDQAWVRWFGGRPNAEIVPIQTLKSLSDGLEAHHKAQKDTRKSRKLNSQLERAIQEAMTELDRSTTTAYVTTSPTAATVRMTTNSTPRGRRPNALSTTTLSPPAQPRNKPVRIAPAPPSGQHLNNQQQFNKPLFEQPK